MAGFSRIYCIGGLGGFMGADGINPILFQILVGDADRQWLEVHYFSRGIRPLRGICSFVPARPDDPNSLLDACILFYPEHFKNSATLTIVEEQLRGVSAIDFHLNHNVPDEWEKLREETRDDFSKLCIFQADLKRIQPERIPWS